MKIVINNHPGGIIQQTDKPIVNVKGDLVQQKTMFAPGAENRPHESCEVYDFVNLEFFDPKKFNTLEKQNFIRKTLKDAMKKMDMESGMDSIAIFIAYIYYIEKLVNIKKYAYLFKDIEGLLPGSLPKVVENEETGDKRYKKYTESLATETKKWFIDGDCLPEMNIWTSNEFKYQVEDDRKRRIQGLVKTIYSGLKACDEIK